MAKFSFNINITALKNAIINKRKESIEVMLPCLEYDIRRYYSLLENEELEESSITRFNRVIKNIRKGLNELGYSIDKLLKD